MSDLARARACAREYAHARLVHQDAARGALLRAVAEATAAANGVRVEVDDDGWCNEAAVSVDGIELTCRCEMPDGSVKYRLRMVTSVAMERAEKRLKQAMASLPADCKDPIIEAARAVFADAKEPFYSCRVDEHGVLDPVQKKRMNERMERYRRCFMQLVDLAKEQGA